MNLTPNGNRALHRSALWLVLTYLLTTVHHVYSSTFIPPDAALTGPFTGSWRAHGFLTMLVPLLLALGALIAYARTGASRWLHPYAVLGGGVFTGIIGVWEGGWNHVTKLVLFAHGLEGAYAYGPSWLLQFPPVQPPKDLFFEATGVLTLAFGLVNAWYLWRVLADRAPAPTTRAARATSAA